MKINREKLLARLQSVKAGLSAKKDKIDQGDCFVFKDGQVFTFNEEINCRTESGLGTLIGAVRSAEFIGLLEELPDELIELEAKGKELYLVAGKKRREAGIAMEQEVLLAVESVDEPAKWRKLPVDEFTEAIQVVGACASSNDARFALTCIHLHPEYLEACDNHQLTRYQLALKGLKSEILIRRDSLKHVATLGMTEFGETDVWMHFRNPSGLTLSCRRYLEEFPDLTPMLNVVGAVSLVLPSGLADAVKRSAVFSAGNSENKVLVEIQPGYLWVSGQSATGWFKERKRIDDYSGAAFSFLVAPELLIELSKRHTKCQVSADRLLVDGGTYQYVSCLTKVKTIKDSGRESSNKEHTQETKPKKKKVLAR